MRQASRCRCKGRGRASARSEAGRRLRLVKQGRREENLAGLPMPMQDMGRPSTGSDRPSATRRAVWRLAGPSSSASAPRQASPTNCSSLPSSGPARVVRPMPMPMRTVPTRVEAGLPIPTRGGPSRPPMPMRARRDDDRAGGDETGAVAGRQRLGRCACVSLPCVTVTTPRDADRAGLGPPTARLSAGRAETGSE